MNDLIALMYDFIALNPDYTDTLFESTEYSTIGIILFSIPLLTVVIFYYGIDRVLPLGKKRHFFLLLLFNIILIVGLIWTRLQDTLSSYIQASDQYEDINIFISDFLMLSVVYITILTLIYTLFIKNWSLNNRHNPWPSLL